LTRRAAPRYEFSTCQSACASISYTSAV
jgi:hypothetical protein